MRVGLAILTGACALTAAAGVILGVPPQPRDALWRTVDRLCMPDKRLLGYAAPCVDVDQDHHYALVRAWFPNELLLVPTLRVSGIEDPALLRSKLPNYWRLAWQERRHLLGGAGSLGGRMIGLAVNSAYKRTQDQLHIHIDCLRADVQAELQSQTAGISSRWTSVTLRPGHIYDALRLPADALDGPSPFTLLAQVVGTSRESMARQTLVLVGDTEGFYLLRQAYQPASHKGGHGEELLDNLCNSPPHPSRSGSSPLK